MLGVFVAVIVTGSGAVVFPVVNANVAEFDPAFTVTEAGTVTNDELLVRVMTVPPAGAFAGSDWVAPTGVVNTDWAAQIVADSRKSRNTFVAIRRISF